MFVEPEQTRRSACTPPASAPSPRLPLSRDCDSRGGRGARTCMRLSLPYAVALCLTDHVTICRARSPLDSFRPTEGQHRGRDEWVLLTLGDAAELLGFQKGSVYEQ